MKPFALALALVTLVSGCTPKSDPVVEKIISADLGSLTLINEIQGHCQPSELFCSNPLFEPAFTAPSEVEPAEVCNSVINLQSEIGLVAYSVEGYSAARVSKLDDLKKFCTDGLSHPWPVGDGTEYYEGTVLYDDGSKDKIGKVTVIQRRAKGEYVVVFSVTKNLSRIGGIPFGETPTHRNG